MVTKMSAPGRSFRWRGGLLPARPVGAEGAASGARKRDCPLGELLITLHSGESDYQASRKTGVMLPWQVTGLKSNWRVLIG